MLKKRILASSMASVMALSSVSVVAFAEETKDYGEAVTKAELQAFIDGEAKFIADELLDYGSVQGEKYQAAIDHAKKVLESEKPSTTEIVGAYQMAKAVKAELRIYSAKELKALITENKAIYDKNNILNEEIQDNVYTTDSFADFVVAYDDADRYVDSEDSRLITDAYVALDDAVKGLAELKTVKKSEFRAALKNYEELTYKMRNYESWRRGTITVVPTTGTSKNKGNLTKASLTADDLYDIVYGSSSETYRYWKNTAWNHSDIKAQAIPADDLVANGGSHTDAEGKWIGSYDVDLSTCTLKEFINDKYDTFDKVKAASVTSNPQIVAACEAAVDAVAVYNGWKVDNYTSGSSSSCASLERKYHNKLVQTFEAAGYLNTVIAAIEGATGETGLAVKDDALKCNKAYYIIKDLKDGLIKVSASGTYTDVIYATEADAKAAIPAADATKYAVQPISAKTDVLKYLRYSVMATYNAFGGLITALESAQTANTNAEKALAAAEKAIADDAACAAALKAYNDNKDDLLTAFETGHKWEGSTNKFTLPIGANKNYTAVIEADIIDQNSGAALSAAETAHNAAVAAIKTKVDLATQLATLAGAANDAYDDINNPSTGTKKAVADAEANLAAAVDTDAEADKVNAAIAIKYYNDYKGFTFKGDSEAADKAAAQAIMDALANGKTIAEAKGSNAEWIIITRYLQYALEDLYPVKKTTTYTLKMLKDKIDEAYEVCEKTGDSSLFAKEHNDVVEARQIALTWYTAAKATTGYKTDMDIVTDDYPAGEDLATVYKMLEGKVKTLNEWFLDFEYSYDDIRTKIADIATKIDNGEVKATDGLKKALADAAYDLSVLQATEISTTKTDDNSVFTDEREFQGINRLKTYAKKKTNVKPNDFEKEMLKSFKALDKAYEEAKKGETKPAVKGDVDGDGVVTFEDVNAVVAAFLASSTDTKYDINGDKVVDFEDVNAAVDLFLKA